MTDLVKPQAVRVLDVFLIGPLMIWGGMAARKTSNLGGLTLAGLGVATIAYNYRNWKRIDLLGTPPERPGERLPG